MSFAARLKRTLCLRGLPRVTAEIGGGWLALILSLPWVTLAAEQPISEQEGGAKQEEAAKFILLKLQGACDAKNNSLWLTNTHTFKTVAVTVRWRADGGKDLLDEFFLTPNSVREIGCAATAEIVASKFADF